MDRRKVLEDDPELMEFFSRFEQLYRRLGDAFIKELNRLPALPDLFVDRWKRAEMLGFGKGTNIYDSSLVIGDVHIGNECWIGPNTILDGSGGLAIGDCCTISAGVQIYSHDNVKQTLTSKKLPIERKGTTIGNNVYIGPQAIITKGVRVGNNVVIGTFSLVNRDVSDNCIVIGQPARAVGSIAMGEDDIVTFNYFNK